MSAEFSWQTADGIKIYGIDWPCEKPCAVVGVIHGLGEHIHRYEHLVEYFHQHNIAVVGYDRRGHGRSGGKKGHTVSYKAFLDEIGQLAVEAEERYPNVPLFLYGHSMGGNLLLNYIIRRHPNVKGAIVSAPHIRLAFQPSVVMLTMGRVMKRIFPGFTQPNGLDVEQISRDKGEVEKYINDPYVHNKLTAITGMSMLEAAEALDKYKGAFPVPLLLMHGGEDGLTSPQGSEDFVGRITGNVTFKKWEGLYHEIHNEPEREEVMAMMVNWINEMV
ncbi:MAG: lysophospholipase [Lewinella sp.]|uniref:alpha/beta hydrolase n=1 Tax=Lewinella sp. TaxID=2004506 RepID=UPI003D6B6CBB